MILAHAFGQRYDLPIPLLLFVLGGAAVVVLSFLLVLPRHVERVEAAGQRPAEDVPATGVGGRASQVWGAVAVVVWLLLAACGLFGSQETAENLLPVLFWLVAWIAVPLSCGLLGDWTRPVNPFAVLARWADRPGLRRAVLGSAEPVRWPTWLGWWPAVVLYFGIACGELIFNETATLPDVTAAGLLAYGAFSALGGLVFGERWLQRGEMFTQLYSTWGRLGYFRFGAPGRRGFAGGLIQPFATATSRIVFVVLLLVSVNFDGLLATPQWGRLERHISTTGVDVDIEGVRVATFVVLTALTLAVFTAFALLAARAGGRRLPSRAAIAGLLPSLLPIAFGYLLAHNLQYLLVNGQLLAPLIGNPVGKDGWPIHLPYPFNDDFEPHPHFLPSSFYWYVSVLVIVVAHIIAVVLAHRELAAHAPDVRRARNSEYPWLVAMVGYTMLSLWLIAQPLVQESPQHSDTEHGHAAATVVVPGR